VIKCSQCDEFVTTCKAVSDKTTPLNDGVIAVNESVTGSVTRLSVDDSVTLWSSLLCVECDAVVTCH